MASGGKGINKIATALYDWSEDDRQDAIEFAMHPANTLTSIVLYLHNKGIKVSLDTTNRWVKSLLDESDKIEAMRKSLQVYRGLGAIEINAFLAASMTEAILELKEKIKKNPDAPVNHRDIQSLTSLAKEARSSALAMNTPHSNSSMKELELGHLLSFMGKLEGIFEGDEVILERVKNACKSIMVEVEGQYQS